MLLSFQRSIRSNRCVLAQPVKMLYYPKHLKMPIGNNLYEYPEVDKIQ